jgi:hypothetical protein
MKMDCFRTTRSPPQLHKLQSSIHNRDLCCINFHSNLSDPLLAKKYTEHEKHAQIRVHSIELLDNCILLSSSQSSKHARKTRFTRDLKSEVNFKSNKFLQNSHSFFTFRFGLERTVRKEIQVLAGA